MLLEGKVAVIYGGGGSIGGTVARAFAGEGARVYLAGRTGESLDAVADAIRADGGVAETEIVDALNEASVDRFIDGVIEGAGRVDISFNCITYGDVQKPLLDISVEDFLQPIMIACRSHFITAKAAARHMSRQGSGMVLIFGGGGPQTMKGLGGFKVSLDAIESLRRQLALELGESGVRVVTIKTGGIPETIPDDFSYKDQITDSTRNATALKRVATLEDVGNVATFVVSDQAQTITGTEINISCGSILE